MRPVLQLCVEYDNGYSVRRYLGEQVELEELAAYLDIARDMVPDQPVIQTTIQIAFEDREQATNESGYDLRRPSG